MKEKQEDHRNEKRKNLTVGRRETKRKKAVCVWGSVLLFSEKLWPH